jgi:hypothetical protein
MSLRTLFLPGLCRSGWLGRPTWMADQLSQAIEHASGSVGPDLRRCPA